MPNIVGMFLVSESETFPLKISLRVQTATKDRRFVRHCIKVFEPNLKGDSENIEEGNQGKR